MNPVTELDIAPLTWVRGEIDAALERALEALNRVENAADGSEQLRFALNHVHQVHGALSVVGLDGATQFAETANALLADLASAKIELNAEHLPLLRRSLIALGNYLAELEDGAPNQPLRLYPLLAELASARGLEAPARSELFFPDLSLRGPQLAAPLAVDSARAAKELRLLRGRFEKGLLAWLRQPSSDGGPREMLFAVQRIAQLNAAPTTRAFWWASIAFFEGLVGAAISSDRDAQRLCRRIDTQMKRLLDGSQVISERLVRDVLYQVASAQIDSQHSHSVRKAFSLDALMPDPAERVAETPLAPTQRALREALENAKEAWNRFAAGAAVGLPQMQEYLAAARKPLALLQHGQVERLVDALDRVAAWLRKDPLKSNDELAMDVATALLVAERGSDPGASSSALTAQIDELCRRLAQREAGQDPGPLDEVLFGETSRHAQEKLFFNQLAREIQTTLGQVEQVLDGYFRNPAAREALNTLAAPLKQVEGAFAVLGEQPAAQLVHTNAERVATLATAPNADIETCEQIAHELSALGFFVEALRHGPAKLERFLVPHGGAVAQPEGPTVEAEVRQQSKDLQQRVEALEAAPADEKLRAELKENLETLRDDAALLNDSRLEQQAREALAALKDGGDSERMKEAVSSIAPAATPQPSPEAARLIEASEAEVDAELLEIFLEEAHEVLASIHDHRHAAEREPHNQENIVTIRRGFHTLKGSSRMVGLNDFSDAGKAVEFAMNRWLQQERDAAPEMLALVDHAHVLLGAWVEQLEAGGSLWKDASALIAEADSLQPDAVISAVNLPMAPPPSFAALHETLPEVEPEVMPEAAPQVSAELDLDLDASEPEAPALIEDDGSVLRGRETPAVAMLDEPETIDLTATLLAPFSLNDFELLPEPESAVEAAEDDISIEASAAETEYLDLTATVSGPLALETPPEALAPPEILSPSPELSEPDDFSLPSGFEELSLTDEEAMPSGAPVEEEVDLTATLLAPLALREALYGSAEPEPAPPETVVAAAAPAAAIFTEPSVAEPAAAPLVASEEGLEELELPELDSETDSAAALDDETLLELDALDAAAQSPALLEASVWGVDASADGVPIEVFPELADSASPPPLTENALDLALEPGDAGEVSELDGFDQIDQGRETSIELAEAEAEFEPDVVMLGDTPVSRPLYELYIAEARQHVATLREELPRFRFNPALVPQEPVIRAAHTLGGISGTARVDSLRGLAKALEHALARLHLAESPPTAEQAELICSSGERIEEMVAQIAERRMPFNSPELVEALESLSVSAHQDVADSSEPAFVVHEPASVDWAAPAANILDDAAELPPDPAFEALAPLELPPIDSAITAPLAAHEQAVPAPYGEAPSYTTQVSEAEAMAVLEGRAPLAETHSSVVLKDDLDEQLLPIFFEEAEELMRDLAGALRELREQGDSAEPAQAVARLLHTLKGSARMAGAMTLGEYVHDLENRLLASREAGHLGADSAEELESGIDAVGVMLTRMQGGLPAIDSGPLAAASTTADGPVQEQASAGVESLPGLETAELQAGATTTVRVRAQLVDRFVNEAGEIAIARTRIEGELRTLRRSLLDLTENVIRLRNQLREVEIAAETQMQTRVALAEQHHEQFDPLEFDRFTRFQELTRMMAESVGDVTTIQQNLLKNLDAADTSLHAQGRLSRDLQQALMGVRMVPFADLSDRLYRVVRQTAKELGKRANLDIRGGQIEIDRSVLDKMTAPLEHLLRNAIAHGLESPEERRAAGKGEIGQITLSVEQRSNEVALELADDGRGLDFEAIRRRGQERGLLAPNEAPSETRLTQLIFEPGFTTASTVSEVAGRGVGMDVVKSETIGVGGRIDVSSASGKGARFIVHLPLTLAITQALLVRANERTFAVPSHMVAQVLELKQDALDAMRAAGKAVWKDQQYPMHYLPRLLGDNHTQPIAGRFHWVLLLRSGPDAVALHVDELRGNQEIVVKNAGPQFTRMPGFSGATVLPDGEISLILNPVVLAGVIQTLQIRAAAAAVPNAAGEMPPPPQAAPVSYVPTVMVTDDSLTVRKITTRLLEREGYRVVTAKDGVDALEQLVDMVPDVMLLDIEMPRMDGFDLARNIRADERLKKLPIIMITSRMADKHRNYAKEIGVNHYLGKPYNEEELLGLIKTFTAAA